MAHRSDELVFRRALTLSQYRDDVNMDIIAHYPIGPVPSSLLTDFGLIRKPTKTDFCMKLESKIASKIISKLSEIPKFAIKKTEYVRDTMGVIQSLNLEAGKTFHGVADAFVNGVMKVYEHADMQKLMCFIAMTM